MPMRPSMLNTDLTQDVRHSNFPDYSAATHNKLKYHKVPGVLQLTAVYCPDHPAASHDAIGWGVPLQDLDQDRVVGIHFTGDKRQGLPPRSWKSSALFAALVEPFPLLRDLQLEHIQIELEYPQVSGRVVAHAPATPRRSLRTLVLEEAHHSGRVSPFHFLRYFDAIDTLFVLWPASWPRDAHQVQMEVNDRRVLEWIGQNMESDVPKIQNVVLDNTPYARTYFAMLASPETVLAITFLQLRIYAPSDISMLKVLLSHANNLEEVRLDFAGLALGRQSTVYDEDSLMFAAVDAESQLRRLSLLEALKTQPRLKKLKVFVPACGTCPAEGEPLSRTSWALPTGLLMYLSRSVEEVTIGWVLTCRGGCMISYMDHVNELCAVANPMRQGFCCALYTALGLVVAPYGVKKVRFEIIPASGWISCTLSAQEKVGVLKRMVSGVVPRDISKTLEEHIDCGRICWADEPRY
ncbi:hypothetical protein BDY19DRAFT_474043 [Irpex rosettiformis]|uniref:Uncharacterized protein n=1 Tax=Irpex rosettiformis TaxID=378272 RepID=A0ACB8TSH5_9APHY|nr:hypothetical protein BDY19DRAFT_474043 [Irpex rosettiformis]